MRKKKVDVIVKVVTKCFIQINMCQHKTKGDGCQGQKWLARVSLWQRPRKAKEVHEFFSAFAQMKKKEKGRWNCSWNNLGHKLR